MSTRTSTSGFYEQNKRWVQPLVAALILLMAPVIMGTVLGGPDIPLHMTAPIALAALVYTGLMARLTDTVAAKAAMFIASATAAIAIGIAIAMWF
ncbi:TPA: hypothetical protein MXV08_004042 [Pseudomonas aeruginosa]|nr:hypothetical protein [Pseudomonas aeruginosa]KSC76927.1 hypothetical protein AO888_02940 [Pseudomonas aeruginosa]HCA5884921.1 hypothetical protein [Pseudomonas aeruginosa]HCA6578184.1 hypothetical protein [Pseudomonas aeruginosa]HCA6932470.1 hypothetical protein [Pseudomonas aeruginosa]HCA7561288.1 hypothetical protein [Pseudomonas aeruginosa]